MIVDRSQPFETCFPTQLIPNYAHTPQILSSGEYFNRCRMSPSRQKLIGNMQHSLFSLSLRPSKTTTPPRLGWSVWLLHRLIKSNTVATWHQIKFMNWFHPRILGKGTPPIRLVPEEPLRKPGQKDKKPYSFDEYNHSSATYNNSIRVIKYEPAPGYLFA